MVQSCKARMYRTWSLTDGDNVKFPPYLFDACCIKHLIFDIAIIFIRISHPFNLMQVDPLMIEPISSLLDGYTVLSACIAFLAPLTAGDPIRKVDDSAT